MSQTDDVPVLPLWIAGRAYLTVPSAFHVVRNPLDGTALRRTPLCAEGEVRAALIAAQAALPVWQALNEKARAALLAALADALEGYATHFAGLLREEGGFELAHAEAEVAAAISALRKPAAGVAGEVTSLVAGAQDALRAPLELAAAALLAGATLVVRPAPQTPSALLACAELTARCGFPPGVFNVVQGGDEVVAALHDACAQHLVCDGAAPAHRKACRL